MRGYGLDSNVDDVQRQMFVRMFERHTVGSLYSVSKKITFSIMHGRKSIISPLLKKLQHFMELKSLLVLLCSQDSAAGRC